MRLTFTTAATCWQELQLLAALTLRFPKVKHDQAERQAVGRFVSRGAGVLARLWGEERPAVVATAFDDVLRQARRAA